VDIIRDTRPQKSKKKVVQISVGVVALLAVTIGLRSLKPAAPSVDAATVWMDTVVNGDMVILRRGPGTLVPEQMRWITAVTSGRVEQIMILPGTEVEENTTIIRMTNPDVEVEYLRSQQQLSDAQVALVQLRTNLETQRLQQEGMVAQTRTQYLDAQRTYSTNQQLYDRNPELVAKAELDRSRELAEELEARLDYENRRLEVMNSSVEEQLRAQETQIERLRDIMNFNLERVESMDVTSGVSGVLAEMPLEEGQWALAGQTLARVVQPGRLKAELRIPQTQAQDIAIGQLAFIDTRNDTIQGRVTRIDPAVQNGTVTIDVSLPTELPASARPDLSVDGTVEIERLDGVVYMGRPAYGQANSRVGIFKMEEDGTHAIRVNVQLGASSVNEIQVVEGLQPGDVVILSDMSQWDGFDRVRLKR
jgi:multidrug resistance efflux pump